VKYVLLGLAKAINASELTQEAAEPLSGAHLLPLALIQKR
jgi:hypothetical protein